MQTDVLIIGSGIAGCAAALQLAQDKERHITVLTRAKTANDSNSAWAQGGIVTQGLSDSKSLMMEDVLDAGAGLGYVPAVETLAVDGPRLVKDVLMGQCNLDFDRNALGELVYGLEAAHSSRRILHVGDATGWAIMQAMLSTVQELPNVTLLTGHTAVDLITFPHHSVDPMDRYKDGRCHGAYVLRETDKKVVPILAGSTILATGGLGQIYQNTSNPNGARGDGLSMAYRAGARIVNSEYVQFHPTTLHMAGTTKFLITEAVRGEGGILLTPDTNKRFMEKYAPEDMELAPRDIVARAIYWEMLQSDYPYMLLDISSQLPADKIKHHFPTIYERLLKSNIDITKQPIPVAPAAHYFCGGALVDLDGRTSIPGLYAAGEVTCTGVHGANRLASTSLLEGLVWGHRAGEHIRSLGVQAPISERAVPEWDTSGLTYDTDPALIQADMQTIRNIMWHYVGLVRNQFLLNRAVKELQHLWQNIEAFYRKSRLTDGIIGLRNAAQSALIVARAASSNKKSLGAHFREDDTA